MFGLYSESLFKCSLQHIPKLSSIVCPGHYGKLLFVHEADDAIIDILGSCSHLHSAMKTPEMLHQPPGTPEKKVLRHRKSLIPEGERASP